MRVIKYGPYYMNHILYIIAAMTSWIRSFILVQTWKYLSTSILTSITWFLEVVKFRVHPFTGHLQYCWLWYQSWNLIGTSCPHKRTQLQNVGLNFWFLMRQKDFWIEGKGHPISDLYRFVQNYTELMAHYRITFESFK